MDFCDTWTQWSNVMLMLGGGNNRSIQEFGVKGHLGVIWCYSNMRKMLLRLYNSKDFDETWLKRSLARCSFGMCGKFWSAVILGSFGVTVNRSNLKQPSAKLTMPVCCQCQPSKSVRGDLFICPVVKGSKVRKFHICFNEGSNIKTLQQQKLTLQLVNVNLWKMLKTLHPTCG